MDRLAGAGLDAGDPTGEWAFVDAMSANPRRERLELLIIGDVHPREHPGPAQPDRERTAPLAVAGHSLTLSTPTEHLRGGHIAVLRLFYPLRSVWVRRARMVDAGLATRSEIEAVLERIGLGTDTHHREHREVDWADATSTARIDAWMEWATEVAGRDLSELR